jgi:RimJ/RimL family protein N-acetyltransferase
MADHIMHIASLHTERLELIAPERQCDAAYQRFYTDPEASAAYGGPLTASAAWARLAFDVGAWKLQGFGVWAVRTRHDQEMVGVCGYWQGRGWPREFTWLLLPEHRGRGLAHSIWSRAKALVGTEPVLAAGNNAVRPASVPPRCRRCPTFRRNVI